MDFALSQEQLMLRDNLRNFRKKTLQPLAAYYDETGDFPTPLIKQIAEMGLLGVAIPENYGGAGMDHLCYAIAIEEISAGCGSCGVITSVNNSLACDPIYHYGTEAQKQQWLPLLASGKILGCFALSEPGTGSDAAAQTTTCTKEANGYRLQGCKNFITNGQQAGVCIVFAMADRSKGVKGIHAFIVPTDIPGFSVAKNEHKMGIKASSTSQINLDQVLVPHDALLFKEGEGFKVAMHTLDGGRIGIAAKALGIAQAAYEAAFDYAQQRHAFGGPLSALQSIQIMLADMACQIEAARLLIYQAALLKDRKVAFGPYASMAKLYASEMSNRVTNKALQIFGGYGYCKDYPLERHLRDARITEIYEGTSEIQRLVIDRYVQQGYDSDGI